MDDGNILRASFLLERSQGLGGADAGVVAGVSTWKRPLRLYYEKTGELPDCTVSERDPLVAWGKRLEPLLRKHYATVTKRKTTPAKFITHPVFPCIVGHPDGYTWRKSTKPGLKTERGVLEIKTAFFTKKREWEKDGIPNAYYLQAQHYLAITGLPFCSFAVLFGGSEFECFDIERDPRIIDLLLAVELDFWERVQQHDPPPITLDAQGQALLRALYPTAQRGVEIILNTSDAQRTAHELVLLKAFARAVEKEMEALETWIMAAMKDAESCFVPGVARFKFSDSSRRSTDFDLLKRDYPEAYAACVSDKPSRRFTVKDLRGDEDTRSFEIYQILDNLKGGPNGEHGGREKSVA